MSRNKKNRNSARNSSLSLKDKVKAEKAEENVPKTSETEAAATETAVLETAVVTDKAAEKSPEEAVSGEKSGLPKENSETVEPDITLLQKVKEHLFSANPVFIKAVAIVPILGAATTLKNGIMLSGTMLLTVVLLNLCMYPLYRIIPRGYRIAASFLVAGFVFTPIYMLAGYIAPTVTSQCSIYLPLLAVCSLPLIERKHYGQKYGIVKTALDAALDGAGFAFAAILVSIIREIIGYGTLYDRALPYVSQMKFSFAVLPAGALLLLGVMLALFRKIYGVSGDDGVHGQDGGKRE